MAKIKGPESAAVHPEGFAKAKDLQSVSDQPVPKADDQKVDVTKHGRMLRFQHWVLTYFDRCCFLVIGIFYIIFSLVVVMVPRDPVIESAY